MFPDATMIESALFDTVAMARAVKGVSAIVHLAAWEDLL